MAKPTITDKRWSIDLEKRIQEAHYADTDTYNDRYGFKPDSGRELFVIDTPPPYPSGTWHIGAVAQYSMIDVIARSRREILEFALENIDFIEEYRKRARKTAAQMAFKLWCRNGKLLLLVVFVYT